MDVTKPRGAAEAAVPADLTLAEEIAPSGELAEVTLLVDRAKTGDADAFGDLMRLYEGRVIALGIQMGLSKDDALDACQDAFVKVFRYIHRFRSGESFFRWLYRIALNAIKDHRRRTHNTGVVSFDELEPERAASLQDCGTRFDARLESDDLARKLLAELPSLTERERIVIVLRDLQEMTAQDVGRILGLSQITVRRHCMSARLKLRARLFPADH